MKTKRLKHRQPKRTKKSKNNIRNTKKTNRKKNRQHKGGTSWVGVGFNNVTGFNHFGNIFKHIANKTILI
jgi:hypothetical protein